MPYVWRIKYQEITDLITIEHKESLFITSTGRLDEIIDKKREIHFPCKVYKKIIIDYAEFLGEAEDLQNEPYAKLFNCNESLNDIIN